MKMKTLITILILNITFSQVTVTPGGIVYNTIGEALQNATDGSVLQVADGTYAESFTIDIDNIILEDLPNKVLKIHNLILNSI